MFDLVRNNKKFIQIVLAFIMLPFALWGVDSYVRMGGGDDVAKVGDISISLGEFQQALRDQQDRLRPQLGGNVDQELLDNPELRRNVLQNLIHQRLLALHAGKSKLGVSDEVLAGFISSVPSLQEGGKFSRERYQSLVASQGMSIEMFEARVRQDLLMQQAMMAVGDAAVSGKVPTDHWLAAQMEERIISESILRADPYLAESKPDAAAVKRYYDENQARFQKPEQVRLAYVVLSQEKLIENAKIEDAAVKAWYAANEARYKQPEQRQASHILLRVEQGAPEADVQLARSKIEQLASDLKSRPNDFPKLAKQHSQDPGSAEKGGDLGFFGRGMMVKPFEDAVFGLKENQISEVVRSDFGFHLIKLSGIRPERVRALAEVRSEIVSELKRQAGMKQYAEAAEGFANTVYEQPDTLQPAAEKFGLTVKESDWLSKGERTLMPPLSNPKLLQAVFAADVVKNRRNTESIEVAPNTLISARVLEHRPAEVESFATVSASIEKTLAREASVARATALGQVQLDKLQKGEKLDVSWGAERAVSRLHAPGLSPDAQVAVLNAPSGKLPVFVGTKVPGGFAMYRISSVKSFADGKDGEAAARARGLRQQYAQVVAQEELAGWLAALQQRFPVQINASALERK